MVRLLTPFLLLTGLVVGFANPIAKRDTNEDLSALGDQFVCVKSAVGGFDPNNSDSFQAMLTQFQGLCSVLQTCQNDFSGNATLSPSDADMAIGHMYGMQKCALDGMSELIDIKSSVDVCVVPRATEEVRQEIIQMHNCYSLFANALIGDLPPDRQQECREIVGPMEKLYAEAIEKYGV